jgi:glycerol kinase
MLLAQDGQVHGLAQTPFKQIFPKPGWVEHDPIEIWSSQFGVANEALAKAGAKTDSIAAIGITNQRETTLVWDRETGRPVYNAIVWQDRRTADVCRRLEADGVADDVRRRTGLRLDPYFSATKIAWILDHVEGARGRAMMGALAFGTVDSFLLWRLTGGLVHATDATNASRTNLYDIHRGEWSNHLARLFDVPLSMAPPVRDCSGTFGETVTELFGRPIPILGVIGDQQAATVGQCGFNVGDIKSTFGTGAFVLVNTGATPVTSSHRLLTTIAHRLEGVTTYALEGSVFVAGAAVQWLRDGLGVIRTAAETEGLAQGLSGNAGVYLVPAFTGLGAPHWDPDARGALFGLTRATGVAELARAALESVCYQTYDLLQAIAKDGIALKTLKVDGGLAANAWAMQFLADVVDLPVERPIVLETTALGAAYMAGRAAGVYGDLAAFSRQPRAATHFAPNLSPDLREQRLAGWRNAVRRTLSV